MDNRDFPNRNTETGEKKDKEEKEERNKKRKLCLLRRRGHLPRRPPGQGEARPCHVTRSSLLIRRRRGSLSSRVTNRP